MPASKKANRIRRTDEFQMAALLRLLMPPTDNSSAYSYSIEEIRSIIDDQSLGKFARPVKLAERMRADDGLYVARKYRLAPQRALCVKLEGSPGKVFSEADALFGPKGVAVSTSTMADINGTFVDHGVAIGYNTWLPREDGSRVDVIHKEWPLEHVEYDPIQRCLVTRVDQSSNVDNPLRVPIVHGDGTWTIYSLHDRKPWAQEAAIMPAAMLWGIHAFGLRDWASSSKSHGLAKATGELPEGMRVTDDSGNLSPDALAFAQMATALLSGNGIFGLRPSGAKLDWMANPSTAWQVFETLVTRADKGFARIYTGTDGILGSVGGAPGIDITSLFGVATTIVQGDLACLTDCFRQGVIEPWAAINHGDSSAAPTRGYMIPDADKQATLDAYATREKSFWESLKSAADLGFKITQDYVNKLAEQHDIVCPDVEEGLDVNPSQLEGQAVPTLADQESVFRVQAPLAHQAEFLAELKKLADKVGGSVLAVPEKQNG